MFVEVKVLKWPENLITRQLLLGWDTPILMSLTTPQTLRLRFVVWSRYVFFAIFYWTQIILSTLYFYQPYLLQSICQKLGIDVGDRLLTNSRKLKFLVRGPLPIDSDFPPFQDFDVVHNYLQSNTPQLQARLRKRGQKGKFKVSSSFRVWLWRHHFSNSSLHLSYSCNVLLHFDHVVVALSSRSLELHSHYQEA